MSENKKQIQISEVLSLLDSGKNREMIKEHYGLSHRELTVLFQHPKLKNRRAKAEISFVLVDDTEGEVVEETATSTVSEEVADLTNGELESVESTSIEVADPVDTNKPSWD